MISSACGGSVTSTIANFVTSEVCWGKENMSLKTGEARERMSLWTRKSRVGGPRALRMMSPSGGPDLPSLNMVVVVKDDPGRRVPYLRVRQSSATQYPG